MILAHESWCGTLVSSLHQLASVSHSVASPYQWALPRYLELRVSIAMVEFVLSPSLFLQSISAQGEKKSWAFPFILLTKGVQVLVTLGRALYRAGHPGRTAAHLWKSGWRNLETTRNREETAWPLSATAVALGTGLCRVCAFRIMCSTNAGSVPVSWNWVHAEQKREKGESAAYYSITSGAQQSGFEAQLYHLPALSSWILNLSTPQFPYL